VRADKRKKVACEKRSLCAKALIWMLHSL
jgi:hypothetical protein